MAAKVTKLTANLLSQGYGQTRAAAIDGIRKSIGKAAEQIAAVEGITPKALLDIARDLEGRRSITERSGIGRKDEPAALVHLAEDAVRAELAYNVLTHKITALSWAMENINPLCARMGDKNAVKSALDGCGIMMNGKTPRAVLFSPEAAFDMGLVSVLPTIARGIGDNIIAVIARNDVERNIIEGHVKGAIGLSRGQVNMRVGKNGVPDMDRQIRVYESMEAATDDLGGMKVTYIVADKKEAPPGANDSSVIIAQRIIDALGDAGIIKGGTYTERLNALKEILEAAKSMV